MCQYELLGLDLPVAVFILPALNILETEPEMAPNPDTGNSPGSHHFINREFVETEKFRNFFNS